MVNVHFCSPKERRLHDFGIGANVELYLSAIPEVGGDTSHGVPDGVIEAQKVVVLIQAALEEDDTNSTSDHTEEKVHAVDGGELLGEDELAQHDEDCEENWEHRAEQIPGSKLLEEQADRQAQPADSIIRGSGLEVGKEEKHALDR